MVTTHPPHISRTGKIRRVNKNEGKKVVNNHPPMTDKEQEEIESANKYREKSNDYPPPPMVREQARIHKHIEV